MKDGSGTQYSMEEFIKTWNGTMRLTLFGAGKYGLFIYDRLASSGITVNSLCDNNKEVLDALKDKYPVRTTDGMDEDDISGFFIIGISRLDIVKAIRKQLQDMGVGPNRMIIPLPGEQGGFFDNRILQDDEWCLLSVRETWLATRQTDGRHIADYFETNDLFRIVLMEEDMVAGWLEEDLKGTGVSIAGKIASPDEYNDDLCCDAIVTENEALYEVLEERLMTQTTVPVISIWDVLRI